MPTSAADLEALKAKLADAVKKPITYSQLVPLQAELDAADAARYHDDGSLPETDNVALIDECYDLLASALDKATDVDARVRPIISNLKGIKKALDRLGHAKAASTEEVQHYQQMLAAIDGKRKEGVFGGDLSDVPAGQAQAVELLEVAFERAHALLEGATDMDSHLKVEVFEPLVKHKRHLAELVKEHATDPARAELELAKVQGMLDAIEGARLANSRQEFGAGSDGKVPAGQAVCRSLLEDCYRLVRKIQEKE